MLGFVFFLSLHAVHLMTYARPLEETLDHVVRRSASSPAACTFLIRGMWLCDKYQLADKLLETWTWMVRAAVGRKRSLTETHEHTFLARPICSWTNWRYHIYYPLSLFFFLLYHCFVIIVHGANGVGELRCAEVLEDGPSEPNVSITGGAGCFLGK